MTSHPLIHIHTELGKKKSVKPVMMILNILKMEVFASFTYLLNMDFLITPLSGIILSTEEAKLNDIHSLTSSSSKRF